MASLYDLTGEWAVLMGQLDGANSPEDVEAIINTVALVEADIDDKADAYAKVIANKEAEAEAYKKEAKRLTDKAKVAEAAVERMKKSMQTAMQLIGRAEIPTSVGQWRLRQNPWRCDVIDIKDVPERYRVPLEIQYTVDKAAIKKDFIDTGELIPGVKVTRDMRVEFK